MCYQDMERAKQSTHQTYHMYKIVLSRQPVRYQKNTIDHQTHCRQRELRWNTQCVELWRKCRRLDDDGIFLSATCSGEVGLPRSEQNGRSPKALSFLLSFLTWLLVGAQGPLSAHLTCLSPAEHYPGDNWSQMHVRGKCAVLYQHEKCSNEHAPQENEREWECQSCNDASRNEQRNAHDQICQKCAASTQVVPEMRRNM